MAYMWSSNGSTITIKPSVNSRQIRLIVMSWNVNNSVNTHYLVPEKLIRPTCTANSMKMDTSCSSHGELSDANNKQDSVIAYEGKQSLDTCSNAKITIERTDENDAKLIVMMTSCHQESLSKCTHMLKQMEVLQKMS